MLIEITQLYISFTSLHSTLIEGLMASFPDFPSDFHKNQPDEKFLGER